MVVSVLIALFLIILLQKIRPVTLRLFFWKVDTSQIILLPLTMAIGFVVGFIVAKVTGNRTRKNNGTTQVDRLSFGHAHDGESFDFAHDHEGVEP
jgi:uncharacterized integral membrane protein